MLKKNSKLIYKLYNKLFSLYGPQGWWPVTKVGEKEATYHKNDYTVPNNESERFEICCGAILTQNTAWKNVIKALKNLHQDITMNPSSIINLPDEILSQLIKPAGYFNQKCKYLKNFSKFYLDLKNKVPSRNNLLKVKGIGEETADSILLYGYKQAQFVIDTYTRRILLSEKLIPVTYKYPDIKKYFEDNLPQDVTLFQEFHALFVEHGKKK